MPWGWHFIGNSITNGLQVPSFCTVTLNHATQNSWPSTECQWFPICFTH